MTFVLVKVTFFVWLRVST